MMRHALLGLLLVSWAPAGAAELKCVWSHKSQCDPKASCRDVTTMTSGLLDVEARTYKRCDRNGCDSYAAEVVRAGSFTTVDLIGRGVFVKLDDDGIATEVVSLGNTVLVSQGLCR